MHVVVLSAGCFEFVVYKCRFVSYVFIFCLFHHCKKQQYFVNDMSISKNLKCNRAVEEEDYSSEKETQTYLIYTRDVGSQTEEKIIETGKWSILNCFYYYYYFRFFYRAKS